MHQIAFLTPNSIQEDKKQRGGKRKVNDWLFCMQSSSSLFLTPSCCGVDAFQLIRETNNKDVQMFFLLLLPFSLSVLGYFGR